MALAPQVPGGAPVTDERAQAAPLLQVVPDVYALGDCCANTDKPLPALAQVRMAWGAHRGAMR